MSSQLLTPSTTATPRDLRVLLIEDSPEDAMLLERHLRRAGFLPSITRIETAEDMHRELAAVQPLLPVPDRSAQGWDIILADYNLPRFSAPEALKLLKNTAHDIPFIMMSGAVSEETAVAAMRAGAHDYVSKENLTRLAPAIEREIAEAASRRHKRAAERALQQSEERFHRLVEATPLALLISDMQGRVVYANAGVQRLLGFDPVEVERGSLTLERILPSPEDGDRGVERIAAPVGSRSVGKTLERNGIGTVGDSAHLSHAEPGHAEPVHAGPVHAGAEPVSERARRAAVTSLLAISLARPGETVERTCVDHSGASIPVLLGAAILNAEASVEQQQLAAFLVDLSEQKRSEEILRRTEKLAAAGRLAASIAHEINNPLEAITNCLYLLQQTELPGDARGYLDLAQQELDRVSHITTQTLRFYRQNSKPAQTDMLELIETVLTLYEPRLRAHGIEVVRDFQQVPPVTAYDGEIRQVLANLVGNGLDAMASANAPLGNARRARLILRVRMTRDWQTREPRVVIVVADTGIGMARATLLRIWEPFFSTKGITGTGLGLWVSGEIITKHGGLVRVRSRQDHPRGTVFRLSLPLTGPVGALSPGTTSVPLLQSHD